MKKILTEEERRILRDNEKTLAGLKAAAVSAKDSAAAAAESAREAARK